MNKEICGTTAGFHLTSVVFSDDGLVLIWAATHLSSPLRRIWQFSQVNRWEGLGPDRFPLLHHWSLRCLSFLYSIWWNTGLPSVTEKISSSLKLFLDSILTAMCTLGGGRQINRDLGRDKYAQNRWMIEDEKTKWASRNCSIQHIWIWN